MDLIVLGSSLCGDTKRALAALDEANVAYDFLDISTSLASLKAFLEERETNPLYVRVKEKGTLGIPLFVLSDGTKTFSLHKVLEAMK